MVSLARNADMTKSSGSRLASNSPARPKHVGIGSQQRQERFSTRAISPCRNGFWPSYLMSDAKKGVSSLQLHRELKISQECCWHLCHRIREAMREDTHAAIFKGIVPSG